MKAMTGRWLSLLASALLVVLLAGCEGGTKGPSLYERLGGKPSIQAIVDQLVGNVAGDQRISHFFEKTEPGPFKAQLVEQLCAATGGPCQYKGRDMRTAHKGLASTEADFNAFMDDLSHALDAKGVAAQEKQELLDTLAPMKQDIVAGLQPE